MNRVVSWLKRIQVRQILTACLVGMIFFVSVVGQFSYAGQAQAAPLTPEATDYKVDRSNTQIDINPQQTTAKAKEVGEGAVESLKDTGNTLVEKLNLNEPLPKGTKTFLKQLKGEDVKVEEPKPSGKGEEPQNE